MKEYKATVARLKADPNVGGQDALDASVSAERTALRPLAPDPGGSLDNARSKLIAELRSLTQRQAPRTHGAVDLWAIARSAIEGGDITMHFNNYLRQHFFRNDTNESRSQHRQRRSHQRPLSRRKRKKKEYAEVQMLRQGSLCACEKS
ncbi:unnamed protein product [Ixodes hexagonus]